jgi:replicative DNA helicase
VVDEKTLPANLEAERVILGTVMRDEMALHNARPVLEPEDFSTEPHRRIWRRACEIYDAGGKVEEIAVFTALRNNGEAESCGNLSYLISLNDGLPLLPDIGWFVGEVKDKSILRKVIFASQHVMNSCLDGSRTPQQVLEACSQTFAQLSPQAPGGGLQSAGELVDEIGLQTLLRPRREQGLPFPWAWMNNMTGGMLPAELWILAAHTSNGKTSAAIQHAVNLAQKGKGVAVFSLEVGKPSLFQKAVYQLSRVDSEKAKRGMLSADERKSVSEAASTLYKLPIYFDSQSTTVMAMHAAVRRRRLKNPIDHIIVDYLQLLGDSGRHNKRSEAVGANAWALKMMACDFQVPVMLLSQFSRQSAKDGVEPQLTDLKESGDIENHANGVWFIHRPSLLDAETVPVKFILPKQRDGRRNVYQDFLFMPRYQRFEALDRSDDEQS